MQRVHLASDHAGFALKQTLLRHLRGRGREIVDGGPYSEDSCDYPVMAHNLCRAVSGEDTLGILICGSGIGMSMAANRHPRIRAALCFTELHARLARSHNNANVLCLGARLTGQDMCLAIVEAFLESAFEGGRHERRLALLTPADVSV